MKRLLSSLSRPARTAFMLGGALCVLGACTAAFIDTASHGIFLQEDINMTERNYAAADYLVQQGRSFIGDYDLVAAQPLTDVSQPEMTSTFGKLVPEQVGIRLSQLGYLMDLSTVSSSNDTNYLRPPKNMKSTPDFILSGNYVRNRTDMDISLRIVDTQNAQIVAVFDYALPLTREIADLAQPKPKIMRMGSGNAAPGFTAYPVPGSSPQTQPVPVTPAEPFQ